MASKFRDFGDPEKAAVYVGRLVYDVLAYTLPKCGFPVTELPPTNYAENVYNRENFVEIVGLSALRIALLLREKWKQMFTSRLKSSGFTKENISNFLKQVVLCCPLSWADTIQSVIETCFALCNEIIMFFHHEGVAIDMNIVLNSISVCIISVFAPNQNVPKAIETLTGKLANVSGYERWLTDFIAVFAIPYGSRQDVPDKFFECVRKQWKDFLQMTSFPEPQSITELRDYLGFLPDDLFAIITYEEPTDLPENVVLASESVLPKEHESSEPKELTASSETDVSGKESNEGQSTQSANVSVDTAEAGESTEISSELKMEDAFGQMNLGTQEASQKSHGAIPKRKKSQKKKKR